MVVLLMHVNCLFTRTYTIDDVKIKLNNYLQKLCEWWDFGVFHACFRTCFNIASMSGTFLPKSTMLVLELVFNYEFSASLLSIHSSLNRCWNVYLKYSVSCCAIWNFHKKLVSILHSEKFLHNKKKNLFRFIKFFRTNPSLQSNHRL